MVTIKGWCNGTFHIMATDDKELLEQFQDDMDRWELMTSTYDYQFKPREQTVNEVTHFYCPCVIKRVSILERLFQFFGWEKNRHGTVIISCIKKM